MATGYLRSHITANDSFLFIDLLFDWVILLFDRISVGYGSA